MSTHQDKVTAAQDFLRNRASLQRLTNHQELGVVLGELLAKRGQRRRTTPVRREKLYRVLDDVDQASRTESGVVLSALVPHFWDNEPGRHLRERLNRYGLTHDEALEHVFEHFEGTNFTVEVTPESLAESEVQDIDDDLVENYGDEDDVEYDTGSDDDFVKAEGSIDLGIGRPQAREGGLTAEDVRTIFREELEKITFSSTGRHAKSV